MKIAVISNCQTYGLANSMAILARNVQVKYCAFSQLTEEFYFGDVDLIFTAPDFDDKIAARAPNIPRVNIPFIYFDRYHPDLTYVSADAENLKGPCDAYHSLVVTAAFKAGIQAKDVTRLFCYETFEAMGYLHGWGEARSALIRAFSKCGLDLRGEFPKWVRSGCFMHSINHPKIWILFAVARLALEKAGISVHVAPDCLVSDNLLSGAVFPVYPEVAEPLSIEGCYSFKVFSSHKLLTLAEFIAASYDLYAKHGAGKLQVPSGRQNQLNALIERLL